jgi:hypothetical protein
LTPAALDVFLRDHLPNCRCRAPANTTRHLVRAALGHFFRLPTIASLPSQRSTV